MPRLRGISAQSRVEHRLGQQLARRHVVGMPIGPVRQRHDPRPRAPHELGHPPDVGRVAAEARSGNRRLTRQVAPSTTRAASPRRAVLRPSRCSPFRRRSDRTDRRDGPATGAWPACRRSRSRCRPGADRTPAGRPRRFAGSSGPAEHLVGLFRLPVHRAQQDSRATNAPVTIARPAQREQVTRDSCDARRCTSARRRSGRRTPPIHTRAAVRKSPDTSSAARTSADPCAARARPAGLSSGRLVLIGAANDQTIAGRPANPMGVRRASASATARRRAASACQRAPARSSPNTFAPLEMPPQRLELGGRTPVVTITVPARIALRRDDLGVLAREANLLHGRLLEESRALADSSGRKPETRADRDPG